MSNKLLLFLIYTISIFSQEKEVVAPFHIKTVAFKQNSNIMIPFFQLGDGFTLEFDDLHGNEEDYYYTVEQFNYDWTPTQLQKTEFLEGQDNLRIQNYQNSFNTLQNYSHYKISFPNKFTRITKSGNYVIYIKDDEGTIIFSRKFILYEPLLNIPIVIRRSRDIIDKDKKHNVEFVINYNNQNLQDPLSNIKVSIYQNGRFDNAIHGIKAQYTLGTELIYRYNKETQFWAGNEFLNFENKNIRAATNMVNRITGGELYNVYLYTNPARKNQIYTYFPDINGNFFPTNLNAQDNDIESDYAWVYFSLKTEKIPPEKSIYVNGMFNNYALTEEFKLDFNTKTNLYEKAILIKQGFTNFQYLITDKAGKVDYTDAVDGNFFQTENNYKVLAYYKGPADRHFRVIGLGTQNSTEIKN